MKKLSLFLSLFLMFSLGLSSVLAQNADIEKRKQDLMSIIDEELKEVLRLNKQTSGRNPDLRIQAAELELEKARILREMEMDRYLAIDANKRSSINKKQFFKASEQYFNEAKKQCLYVLKKYPTYSGKADAYYILAYHARDIESNTTKAAKYFEASRKYARSGTPLYDKSTMALAEMYYNMRQYNKAIPLYESALKGSKNKWWTKDTHSLAWSYFRVGQKNKAIALLEQVEKASKNPNFIDMSSQAQRDLAYFYTSAGKISEAVKMASSSGGNAVDNLYSIAMNTRNQGQYQEAGKTLVRALKSNPNREQEIKIHLAIMDIADRLGRYDRLYSSSSRMAELHTQSALNKEDYEQLKFYTQKSAAALQAAVVGKAYRHQKGEREKRAGYAVKFFEILKQIKQDASYKIDMLIAETYYSIDNFNEAVPYYDQALDGAQKAGDKKLEQEALAGLSTSLDKPGTSKKVKDKYLTRTYLAYLQKNPTGKEAHKVYQRLFNLYYQQKDLANCEKALLAFKRYFPKDVGVQEAMLGQIIDTYKGNKDIAAMKTWLDRINSNEFNVNPKFKARLSSAITTMRFENVESANSKGDKVNALRGYMSLYADPSSSDYEKKNAAYNIAILFNMLGNAKLTYSWTMRALEKMDSSDVQKFETSFISIATFLFNIRQFDWAIDVNSAAYQKLCATKSNNKEVFFKNIYVLKIAQSKVDEIPSLLGLASNCHISSAEIDRGRLELISELEKGESWQQLEEQLAVAERNRNLWGELIIPANSLYNAYQDAGRSQLANKYAAKIDSYFSYAEKSKQNIPLESRDIVANFRLKTLFQESQKLDGIELVFPEKVFNVRLKQKLGQLDRISARALELSKVRSGKGIVRAYRYLVDSYEKVADEIAKFTPPGVSPEYLASFRKAIAPLSVNLINMAKKFRADASKEINSSTILSSDNSYFMMDHNLPIKVEYRYFRKGVIMDRGGQR